MKDNEIIKALECCLARENCEELNCEMCPLEKFYDCKEGMFKRAIALINRQQAEIERLEKLALERHLHIQQQKSEIEELIQTRYFTVRAEAIKKFAEKFNSLLAAFDDYDTLHIYEIKDRLDLVKEMVGEYQ